MSVELFTDIDTVTTNGPCITVFTSEQGPLNKLFYLQNGKICKDSRASFSAGFAETVVVETAHDLSKLISGLRPNQAISTGVLQDRLCANITTKQFADHEKLSRSKDNFTFPARPGWLFIDHDDAGMPEEVRRRVSDLGGPLAALFELWPDARDAEYLIRPSSSNGVGAPGIPPKESTGFHGFFFVPDVSKSKEILNRLQKIAWDKGLAWFRIGQAGQLLERSIVDTAVGSPERLIFEAQPEVIAPVFRTTHKDLLHRGVMSAMPKWHDTDVLREAARDRMWPEAQAVRADYISQQAKTISITGNVPLETAHKIIRHRLDGNLLSDDDYIFGPNGNRERVGSLLDRLTRGMTLSLPDPIEGPNYGRTTATLRWQEGFSKPVLISHAHGVQTTYQFTRFMNKSELMAAEDKSAQINLPAPFKLPNGRIQTIKKALQSATAQTALPIAVAALHKLQKQCPNKFYPSDILSLIQGNLPNHISFTPEESKALKARLEWILAQRKKTAIDYVSMPEDIRSRHRYRPVSDLNFADWGLRSGVVVLRAPMGAGKTQHFGKPLIDAAKGAGKPPLAICHRVALVDELSHRLGLAHYQTASVDNARMGLVTCLPSINHSVRQDALPKPKVIFIDEIAQVLEFLESPECGTRSHPNYQIFHDLQTLIRQAETVVVADAHVDKRTIYFLEQCRPGEQFDIIEMQPKAPNKSVTFFDCKNGALSAITQELASGGKVWLATESARKACALARMFHEKGYKTLAVTADNKGKEEVAKLLSNADEASRGYDLIVASPVISSGISVEHREEHHFTLVGFIGSGNAITPRDAMQQLGRVRYATRFVVSTPRSNLNHPMCPERLQKGLMDAAALEALPCKWTNFDEFKVNVTTGRKNARTDFAAGLFWILEHEGWTVLRAPLDQDTCFDIGFFEKQIAEEDYALLCAAEPLSYEQAIELRKSPSLCERALWRLKAHLIRCEFGLHDLTHDVVKRWKNGEATKIRERFEDFAMLRVPLKNEDSVPISMKDLRNARRLAYGRLFNGVDLMRPLSKEVCVMIVERLLEFPETLAAIGIVSPKYAWRKKEGGFPAQPMAEVKKLLSGMGLKVSRVLITNRPKTHDLSKEISAKQGQKSGRADGREYAIVVTKQSWDEMRQWVERHHSFDLNSCSSEQLPPSEHQEEGGDMSAIQFTTKHQKIRMQRYEKMRYFFELIAQFDGEGNPKCSHQPQQKPADKTNTVLSLRPSPLRNERAGPEPQEIQHSFQLKAHGRPKPASEAIKVT